jgi:hypothetical protein
MTLIDWIEYDWAAGEISAAIPIMGIRVQNCDEAD